MQKVRHYIKLVILETEIARTDLVFVEVELTDYNAMNTEDATKFIIYEKVFHINFCKEHYIIGNYLMTTIFQELLQVFICTKITLTVIL